MKGANVQVVDPDAMSVTATIPAAVGAHNVTFSQDGKWALIANVGANSATIIDADAKQAVVTVPAGQKAHEVSISPDGKLAAAANVGADFVTLIDVAAGKPLKEITTADGAMMSVFSPDGATLYVANANAGTISVVKVNTDENPRVAASYGITSIPTLNVYSGGELVKSIVGARPKPVLVRELADFLG